MEAKIFNQTKDSAIIRWSDDSLGYGELTMHWNKEMGRLVMDTEMMSVPTVIKIIKAL